MIDVHLKPNSREFLVKYMNHKYEQINFASKNYLQNMNLENEDTKDPSSYPCIDPFIGEFCKNVKVVDNFLSEVKYSVRLIGYVISLDSIYIYYSKNEKKLIRSNKIVHKINRDK